jgi:hypothetical protein
MLSLGNPVLGISVPKGDEVNLLCNNTPLKTNQFRMNFLMIEYDYL